jgi:hypothetical protein
MAAESIAVIGNLQHEFPGGSNDKGPGAGRFLGFLRVAQQPGKNGDQKSRCLARACLGTASCITAA